MARTLLDLSPLFSSVQSTVLSMQSLTLTQTATDMCEFYDFTCVRILRIRALNMQIYGIHFLYGSKCQ